MKKVSTESAKTLSGKKVYIGIDVHRTVGRSSVGSVDARALADGRDLSSFVSLIKLIIILAQNIDPSICTGNPCLWETTKYACL